MEIEMEKVTIERYPDYKDSGESWIGDIPEHWELKKLKHLFTEKRHTSNPTLNGGSISFGKVIIKDDEKIPLSTKASYQEVLKGEFLINPLNLNYDLISLRIALSDLDVVVSPGYIVLKNITDLNKNYFRYLLHRYDVAYMKLLGSGVRQTISFTHIANSFLLLPPVGEQNVIAAFLDRKTTQIDKAIAQKEKLIELLKERRQIFIHKAVTRGLGPNVKMKDSGVKWIGEIPEHWELKRLKYLGKIKYGLGQPPKEKDGGLPFIRATNVERGKIVRQGLIFVDPDDIPWDREPALKENDIIVVRSGAYTADSARITKEFIGSIAGYDMVITPQSISSPFLSYSLLAKYILFDQLYLLRMRAAQPHLNSEELGETLVLCPPKEEQESIIELLDRITDKVAEAILCKRIEIEKLKEYKATVINAAVTGKIKLC